MNFVSKNLSMRVVNYALLLLGSVLVGTGWLLGERLPRGREGRDISFLTLHRDDWAEWHELTAYGVIALTVVHLVLNRHWIYTIGTSKRSWQLVLGIGVVLLILAASVLVPLNSPLTAR